MKEMWKGHLSGWGGTKRTESYGYLTRMVILVVRPGHPQHGREVEVLIDSEKARQLAADLLRWADRSDQLNEKNRSIRNEESVSDKRWTSLQGVEDVTEEILEIVRGIESGWYQDQKIDWENVLDRMDGAELSDGSYLDVETFLDSPAIRKIKLIIRRERAS